MNSRLTVELGAENVIGHCDLCGHETRVFSGFVSKNGNAHAVYFARYTQSHPEMGVAMAVSLRGWGQGADTSLKDCVALRWQIFDTGPGCTVLDATDSPWAIDSLLGRMLSRAEALSSGRAKDAFAVTDAVWDSDARLLKAVNGS